MQVMHYHQPHHNQTRTPTMATTKPRITITLNERQHAVLRSISENSGQSMSAFVHELLEQSLPVLERMAETFRKIKGAQDEQRRRIVQELDDAQTAVEPVLNQVLGQFDLFMGKVERAAGVGDAERSSAPQPQALDPRPVITGVRSPRVKPSKTSSKPAGTRKSDDLRGG
jgi:uncharacterized protein (DUF1778 family)